MNKVALITGASSGLGKEFAFIHARNGDDVVLIARREEALLHLKNELESKYPVHTMVIVSDLSRKEAPFDIFAATEAAGKNPDYLINNAGFGGHGYFHEQEPENDLAMIHVNIRSLVLLTRLYLPGMIKRKSGKVLNISSSASFLPGPFQSTYYASKAFVTSFSQALDEELKDKGITVTALCPGLLDTGFIDTAGMDGVKFMKRQKPASPERTAKIGYRAMMKGKLIAFDNLLLRLSLRWFIHFLPRRMVLKISRMSMEKG